MYRIFDPSCILILDNIGQCLIGDEHVENLGAESTKLNICTDGFNVQPRGSCHTRETKYFKKSFMGLVTLIVQTNIVYTYVALHVVVTILIHLYQYNVDASANTLLNLLWQNPSCTDHHQCLI